MTAETHGSMGDFLRSSPRVINLGLRGFAESIEKQGAEVVHVNWKPPASSNPEVLRALKKINFPEIKEKIEEANHKAIERIINSDPFLVDIMPAKDVIPDFEEGMLLHAGPPVKWEKMCGPVRGAIMGALVYEGWARDIKEAEKLASSGKIRFDPCHHHRTVGPMAGVVSPSMYVYVVENRKFKNMAFCTLNEGLGKVLRFGAYGGEVISRLKWMENVLGPALQKAVRASGGISIKNLVSRALQMGDECHNRNVAATSLFIRTITPYLLSTDLDKKSIKEVVEFLSGNDHTFLNISMAAAKASTDPILGLDYSSIVSAMARNGTELGIRVAALGERWFTDQAGIPKGLYFPGFSEVDSCRDLGDSTVTEVSGVGGFAMAAAPAIVSFVGGRASDAVRYTEEMYEITYAEHRDYKIPALDFRGTPLGMDIRYINSLGIFPIINTGIAHKDPGIGQIGAGILRAPHKCFEDAIVEFAKLF